MGHPLRDTDPDNYHLVTVRTLRAAVLMVPSDTLNALIGGIVARYQELFSITLFAYCILGNHLHLLLRAPQQNVDEFMENVLREIARRVNWELKQDGVFWGRRYDDQVIRKHSDLEEALLYIATNSVKHGLSKKASRWPGLGCYQQLLSEEERTFPFVFRSKKDKDGKPLVVYHTLKLTPLPQYAHLSKAERTETLRDRLAEREAALQQGRAASGEGFMTPEAVKAQRPGRRPVKVSRSPRPICYTKDPAVRRAYKADRREFRRCYREASEAFRAGNYDVEFPRYCHKPPAHRKPKGCPLPAAA